MLNVLLGIGPLFPWLERHKEKPVISTVDRAQQTEARNAGDLVDPVRVHQNVFHLFCRRIRSL